MTTKIKNSTTEGSKSEKVWTWLKIVLSFDNHITDLCRKTSQKIHLLSSVAS